jgi:lipoprotein-anchoring transpeptidase ErfK/SrfK
MQVDRTIWFRLECSFFLERMQRKIFGCLGWLLIVAAMTVPQPGIALPSVTTEPEQKSQTKTQPMRLEIRVKQRRVDVYQGETKIKSYTIAVGRPGWETPKGTFKIQQKLRNPVWIHPFTGEAVPGGDPENPLGRFWIGFWTDGKNWIGFHGTPKPESVGTAASHGCIRMYNQDIEALFAKVSLGTEVTVKD